jgi:PAS domain S-box-containing protein
MTPSTAESRVIAGEKDVRKVLDLEAIQKLMESFYNLTKIGVGLIDLEGNVLVATGWQDICTKYHRVHPQTLANCVESDVHLSQKLEEGTYRAHRCKNNMWDMATPVTVDGVCIANLFLGQFLLDDEVPEIEAFRRQAKDCGFDEEEYLAALDRIPRWSGEKVRQVMEFYSNLAGMVAKLSYRNMSLAAALSERKRAEEALQQSEERYRMLFEGANDAIVLIRDGRCVDCNSRMLEMFGFCEDEIIGKTPADFSPMLQPGEIGSAGKAEEKMMLATAGIPQFFEWRHCRGDGTLFDTEISLSRLEYQGKTELLAIIRDVTQRKVVEKALRQSEEKFASAFRGAPSALSISTIVDARFVDVNETFERITGHLREEVIGRSSLELHIWDSSEERECFLLSLRENRKVRDFQGRFRRKSGEVFVGMLSAEIITIGGEESLLAHVEDVTERKRMEEEIEILNTRLTGRAAELEAANAELEAFNYTVSHDLNSPLMGVKGYAGLLLEMGAVRLGVEGAQYVRQINKAASDMEQLIQSLLGFSRASRVEMTKERIDLTAIAHEVADRLRVNDRRRQVKFVIDEGVSGEGDSKLLRVVIENLLGNAWKYTGKREKGIIRFGTVASDHLPAYFVSDNGTGFEIDDPARLFEPFERLDETTDFAGHGIGLATVQKIVRRHGGRVWAEGKPGEGATFYFTL